MNITWNVIEEDRNVKVRLAYNVYLGIKKIYVNNAEVLKLRGFHKSSNIAFKHSNKEYSIQLIPEGYDYTGFLVTPEGDKVACEADTKIKKKTAVWILPFVIINMIIPIISIEAFTPWLIGIVASYITAKVSQGDYLSTKMKVLISAVISTLAWIMCYMFYLMASKQSSSNGFLPF
jgi:hypothetical protein